MLPSAIVVFREVFEIVLIVGIVLAATREMPGRLNALLIGLGSGLLGSALVAAFTGKISSYAEGMGQEYFNAGILLVAAGFIGWTVLWMKKHARHMKRHFEDVSRAVSEGTATSLALSAVIALTMLREGSEIVLFTYGMLASGQPPAAILAGSTLGMLAGLVVGGLLYFGLIKLSVRVFFHVTSWLLVLLVAGMVSQAFGFLVAAGAFENMSATIWDTSWILSEHGLFGQSLGTLVGYTARPTIIQLIMYVLTLVTLVGTMKMIDKNVSLFGFLKAGSSAAVLALMIFGMASPAHATKKVYTPYVEKGELELEYKGGVTHDDDNEGQDGKWIQKLGIGYGFTDRIFLEVAGEVENEGDDDNTEFTAVEFEGKFMLTEPGEYWLDTGLLAEYEINANDGPDKAEAKLLLAKSVGKFSHAANIILEREVGDDASDETEAGLAWSTRYNHAPAFEPGFELHSNFGALSEHEDFEDQDHRLGPVVYGKLGSVKYDVGYLFGLSDAAPDGTLKAILEYEWHF